MTYGLAILLGLVQGVAEFLPISSSGHLTLLQHYYGLEEADSLFNILLHFATLLAVCLAYRQDIMEMIVEFFAMIKEIISKDPSPEEKPLSPARRLVFLIILGTLPLFFILPIDSWIESFGNNPYFVSCALLCTGTILYIADRCPKGKKNIRSITVKDVLLIGIAQGFATVPGLSRSGSTISMALLLGVDRNFAVRFSFLLSLPAVAGATILKIVDMFGTDFDTALLPLYGTGMIISFVVGYYAIQLVKTLTNQGKFGIFAYYCWIMGGISLITLGNV
ncbi:MAG: undecaprenyl-diphosphate phosphatase [Eubacteriales bacterium]